MKRLERIAIGWEVGLPSGWGMYGLNLAMDLARRGIDPALLFLAEPLRAAPPRQLEDAVAAARQWQGPLRQGALRQGTLALDFPLLQALGDKLDLPDRVRGLTGQPTIGVAFCESAVIPRANLAALADFSGFVTGSSWNTALLESHGLMRVRFCPQGVDLDLFKPAPRRPLFPGRFAVFSGGKLEYRKGQDLVIAAFKKFRARHADALLVTAWHNPWPAAAAEMAKSHHVTGAPPVRDGRLDVDAWLAANGLDPRDYVDLGEVGHAVLPEVLHGVDVALLPSRCEGGTNLVAMECMAAGLPTILSRNTGHLDLIGADNCYVLDFQIPIGEITGRADLMGWGESSIDEIVSKLEAAYADRAEAARRGANAAAFMQSWGWPAQIGRLLEAVAAFS